MLHHPIKAYRWATMLGLGLMTATLSTIATAGCNYTVTNSWGSGFTATIRVTNDSNATINGWQVNWAYNKNTVSNVWNAQLSGNYTATNMGWNGSLRPGQSAEFGIQGVTNGGAIETPRVTGAACDATSPISSSIASSSAASAISSSVAAVTNSVNIAGLATATTSYVSPWETLRAVNDNSNPANSNDKSAGAYGNWNNPNSIQWVQYDWPQDYTLSSTQIYWFDDNGGVLTPTRAYLEYWNGNAWVMNSAATSCSGRCRRAGSSAWTSKAAWSRCPSNCRRRLPMRWATSWPGCRHEGGPSRRKADSSAPFRDSAGWVSPAPSQQAGLVAKKGNP